MSELASNWEREQVGERAYRQTFHLRPIAHLKDGAYQRITNVLGASGDPALSVGVDELVQFRVRDRIAGESPLLFFGKGANSIRMTPLDTNNCTGVVSGNSLTFPGVRKGADLRLTLGGHRLETEWLLKAGHPSVFAWRLDSHTGFDPDTLDCGTFRFLHPILLSPDGLAVPLAWAVSTSGGKYVLTCVLPEGDYAGWVLDPTLSLQPDETGGVDTWLDQANATTNRGTSTQTYAALYSAGRILRSALKFDLSSIPAGSTIDSGTLSIWTLTYNTGYGQLSVRRILAGNTGWTELGATWNTIDGATAWAGSAGCGTSGTDYSATSMGTFTETGIINANTERPATLVTAEVTLMLATNDGLLILAVDETTISGVGYHSSGATTAAYRPKIVINYTAPAGALSIPVAMAHYARLRRT